MSNRINRETQSIEQINLTYYFVQEYISQRLSTANQNCCNTNKLTNKNVISVFHALASFIGFFVNYTTYKSSVVYFVLSHFNDMH